MLINKPLLACCVSTVLMFGALFSNLAVADNIARAASSAVANGFPAVAATALRQDVNKRTGIPVNAVRILKAVPQTWPNGCLGVPETDEMCSQALVEGWLVTLSDGSRRWEYHTDNTGLTYRLAHAP